MVPCEEEFEIIIIYNTRQTYKRSEKGEKEEKEEGFKPTQNLKATSRPRKKPTP